MLLELVTQNSLAKSGHNSAQIEKIRILKKIMTISIRITFFLLKAGTHNTLYITTGNNARDVS